MKQRWHRIAEVMLCSVLVLTSAGCGSSDTDLTPAQDPRNSGDRSIVGTQFTPEEKTALATNVFYAVAHRIVGSGYAGHLPGQQWEVTVLESIKGVAPRDSVVNVIAAQLDDTSITPVPGELLKPEAAYVFYAQHEPDRGWFTSTDLLGHLEAPAPAAGGGTVKPVVEAARAAAAHATPPKRLDGAGVMESRAPSTVGPASESDSVQPQSHGQR